jgi:RNA recognition motif-containing protein
MEKSPRRARSHTRSPDRRPREPSRSVTPVRRSSQTPERRRVRERSRSRERAPRERSPDRGRYRSPERDRRRDYDKRDARGRSRSRERTRNSERYRGNGRGRPGNTVFVAGFNFITTERDLDRKFSKYGRVIDVRIVKDRRNGESKGFGFVTMETDEDADEAVYKLDQTTWNGRVVLVEKAKSDKRVD